MQNRPEEMGSGVGAGVIRSRTAKREIDDAGPGRIYPLAGAESAF